MKCKTRLGRNAERPVIIGRNGRIRTCDPLTPSQLVNLENSPVLRRLYREKCKTRGLNPFEGAAVFRPSAKRNHDFHKPL